jgi:predicted ATP-dependent endonuclease of OLD family
MKKKGIVLIPDGYKPSANELWAAHIIAEYYDVRVEFIEPENRYMEHTADVYVDGVPHEIKTPKSNKAKKVFDRLADGAKQADSLIVNSRETSVSTERIKGISMRVLERKRNIKKIIIIDGKGEITEISRRP